MIVRLKLIAVLLIGVMALCFWPHAEYMLDIPKNATSGWAVQKQLWKHGYLRPFLPLYYMRGKPVQWGEYCVTRNTSPLTLLRKLIRGDRILYKCTIPEGLTVHQIVSQVKNLQALEGAIIVTPDEGSLFPATYLYYKGMMREALIASMRKLMEQKLQQLWQRTEGVDSPQSLVILASIVEKEAKLASERTRIARVFLNRLKKNMRLQADPTVIYGVCEGKGHKILTHDDLQQDNAYNTYTRHGLPPTPICCPGEASLRAVLTHADDNSLYFVADGRGGHYFSDTLAQHNVHVQNLRTRVAQHMQ